MTHPVLGERSEYHHQCPLESAASYLCRFMLTCDFISARDHDAGFSTRAFMLYTGLHFDAVKARGSGATVFSPTDGAATTEAKRLAASLRQAGHFSDKKTMQLRCKICNTIVNGDYEARLYVMRAPL